MTEMTLNTEYYGEMMKAEAESSMIGKTRDRKKILNAALDLMDGERAKTYGDALELHRRIAAGWSEILGVKVEPHEVTLCMAWLKIARLVETPDHDDSYVDLVAYGSLAGEIQARDSAKRG